MIDDVFSLILLSMLTALQGDGRVSAWAVLRPLVASLAVLLIALAAHALLTTHRTALDACRAALPHTLQAAAAAHATETLLLVVVGGGALAAWLSEGLYSTMLLGAFSVGAVLCTTPAVRPPCSGAPRSRQHGAPSHHAHALR